MTNVELNIIRHFINWVNENSLNINITWLDYGDEQYRTLRSVNIYIKEAGYPYHRSLGESSLRVVDDKLQVGWSKQFNLSDPEVYQRAMDHIEVIHGMFKRRDS